VTQEFLSQRTKQAAEMGWPKAKWIRFCELLLVDGLDLELDEAKTTFSKYITVRKGKKKFRVRFSNHKPRLDRELAGLCDFFVGVANNSITTTDDALRAVRKFFADDIMDY
jgi:hypothetical protein